MKDDIRQLACYLCDIDRTSRPLVVEWHLRDTYDISMESFDRLTRDLLPLIDEGPESLLSKNRVRGFATRRGGAHRRWLLKEVVR